VNIGNAIGTVVNQPVGHRHRRCLPGGGESQANGRSDTSVSPSRKCTLAPEKNTTPDFRPWVKKMMKIQSVPNHTTLGQGPWGAQGIHLADVVAQAPGPQLLSDGREDPRRALASGQGGSGEGGGAERPYAKQECRRDVHPHGDPPSGEEDSVSKLRYWVYFSQTGAVLGPRMNV